MRFASILAFVLALSFWCVGAIVDPAYALTQVKVTDLTQEECPPEIGRGTVISGGGSGEAASCYLISGKAINDTDKLIYDADVFGRIYDANGNPVKQNRTRLGLIEEIPPGTTEFTIRTTVPSNQPGPLQLKQFKASGFAAPVRR